MKLILKLILFSVILIFLQVSNLTAETGQIEILSFYSSDCLDCEKINNMQLKPFINQYNNNFILKEFDIDSSENYELLLKIESALGDTNNQHTPVVIINNKIFSGGAEIDEFQKYAVSLIKSNIVSRFDFEALKFNEPHFDTYAAIKLFYFYSQGCRKCGRVERDLQILKKKYPALELIEFDISEIESIKTYQHLAEKIGLSDTQMFITPSIFVGSFFIADDDINYNKLLDIISNSEIENIELDEINNDVNSKIVGRFSKLGISALIFAGLIDGINPCAFAVIIFFISYFSLLKQEKKKIFLAGLFYIAGVFIAYFLIGLGLAGLLHYLEFFSLFSKIILFLMICFLFVLSLLSFYDFFMLINKKSAQMKLQLPLNIKRKIHNVIKKSAAKPKLLLLSAFVAGLVISVYEFGCTGQIYIPTIMFALKIDYQRGKMLGYLLLYNLMFVFPLIVVFLVFYFGVSSEKLTAFAARFAAHAKFVAGVLFFALAILLMFL